MKVIFENSGEIDTRLISSFGVNVKENDSPIGYFGTGMKYALAILMREKISVKIAIGEKLLEVGTEEHTIRGVKFSFITLGDETLNFTTELGKNWKLWMAYRELYTNCMDERGEVYELGSEPVLTRGTTKVIIESAAFTKLHNNREEYFLDRELLYTGEDVTIHTGENKALFFQNIRVLELPMDSVSIYSYNLKDAELTEDRTLKSTFVALRELTLTWAQCDDEDMIEQALTSGQGTLEYALDYDLVYRKPSDVFLATARRVCKTRFTDVNPTVEKLIKKHTLEALPDEVELDDMQQEMLNRALVFWNKSGWNITNWPIKAVNNLGECTLGMAKDGVIYISLEAFESGVKQLAITLFEEYIHLEHKVPDCSRAMQEKLLHIITKLAEKNTGAPL